MDDHSLLAPEEQECLLKQAELAELESQLTDAEVDLATLRAELKAFEEEYLRVVAPCLSEMEGLQAEAAEARARQATEEFEAPSCSTAAQQAAFCPPAEMKSLFREVAKNIHPDLASNEDERRRRDQVMAAANAAYADGNREQLRKLLLEWKADPDAIRGDEVAARLIRLIRMIARVKQRMAHIREEKKTLRGSDLYFLCQRAEHAAAEGRDMLTEMRANLETQVAQQRARVAEMQRAAG